MQVGRKEAGKDGGKNMWAGAVEWRRNEEEAAAMAGGGGKNRRWRKEKAGAAVAAGGGGKKRRVEVKRRSCGGRRGKEAAMVERHEQKITALRCLASIHPPWRHERKITELPRLYPPSTHHGGTSKKLRYLASIRHKRQICAALRRFHPPWRHEQKIHLASSSSSKCAASRRFCPPWRHEQKILLASSPSATSIKFALSRVVSVGHERKFSLTRLHGWNGIHELVYGYIHAL